MNAQFKPAHPPSPTHRPMSVTDLDAVMAVETVAYSFPWTRGNFIDSLAAGHRCDLRLGDAGEVIGYSVAMTALDELHLLNITVNPVLQGQGHAMALMDRLIAHGRHQGQRTLWLEVRPGNTRARRLYRHCGMREVGLRRDYYPAGLGRREDAIVMSLALPDTGPSQTSHGLD